VFLEGAEDAGHHEEVASEVRRWRIGEFEEAVCGFAATGFGPVGIFNESVVGLDAVFLEGGAPTTDAVGASGESEIAGDNADAFVALFDEMFDGETGAKDIIGANRVAGERLGDAADADDGAFAFDEAVDGFFSAGGHKEQESVNLAAFEEAQIANLGGELVVGIAEEEGVAVFTETVLDAADNAGVEGVGDVGDQHADRLGAARLERAGDGVGGVIKLLDGLLDSLRQFGADVGGFIDDARDSVGRDAGEFGNVVDCWH
jgi:hypothetical protein